MGSKHSPPVVHAGMEIYVPTLFGYYKGKISDDLQYAESEHTLSPLVHDPIRGLVSSSSINKRALHKLELIL